MTGFNGTILGKGIPGATNNQSLCRGTKLKNLEVIERSRLRRAFGNSSIYNMYNNTSALLASSQGKAKLRVKRLGLGDGVRQGGSAAWSGNVKYVYDSSDYTRYRKLRAKNQTYNDINLAGKNASTVFTVLNRVRS